MSQTLRGAILMIIAMAMFAVEDALIKILTKTIPTGQVLVVIGLGGAALFAMWMIMTGRGLWLPAYTNKDVLARSGCEMFGGMFFVTALSLIPLTTASAVIQATPLVVASGAALFLGQTVGWRRWLAICIGFAGVLLIIRPGGDSFQPATLLAVFGMLCLAARDLITRSLQSEIDGPHLAFHAYFGVTLAGVFLMIFAGQGWAAPNVDNWIFLLLAVVISMVAYLAIVAATRQGDAATTSSFRYSRMLFALIIGYIAFNEVPDFLTLIGITIVIASGLFTLIREARLARASQA